MDSGIGIVVGKLVPFKQLFFSFSLPLSLSLSPSFSLPLCLSLSLSLSLPLSLFPLTLPVPLPPSRSISLPPLLPSPLSLSLSLRPLLPSLSPSLPFLFFSLLSYPLGASTLSTTSVRCELNSDGAGHRLPVCPCTVCEAVE